MTTEISDEDKTKRLSATVKEGIRLRRLSNEQLVRLFLNTPDDETDLITEEMCQRLWPEWKTSEL